MTICRLPPELVGASTTMLVHDLLPRAQLGTFVHFWTNFAGSVREIPHDLNPIESSAIGTRFGLGARKKRMASGAFFFSVEVIVFVIEGRRRIEHVATMDRAFDLAK